MSFETYSITLIASSIVINLGASMGCELDESEVEWLISTTVDKYVEYYKKSHIVVAPDLRDIHIEAMVTSLDAEYSIVATLKRELSCSVYHLPLRIQRRLPIYLTKELEIQIGVDHYEYWAWSAEVFKHFERELGIPHSVVGNFFTPFHGALMRLTHIPTTRERALLNRVIQTIVDHHVQEFLMDKPLIVASVSFLVLEAIVRELCIKYGTPREDAESIRGLLPLAQKLLKLFRENPDVPAEFRQDLQEFMDVVDKIWGPKVKEELEAYPRLLNRFEEKEKQGLIGWRVLSHWRNKLYHGSKTWLPKVYGVVLNLICLLMWHQISEEQYENALGVIVKKINQKAWLRGMGDELVMFGLFYPPSL